MAIFPDSLLLGKRLAAAVANVKDVHRFAVNSKENPIRVGLAAVEELANLKTKPYRLRSKGAALWKYREGCNGLLQRENPPNARLSGVLG
jgi:hypothetical protein